MWRGPTWPIQTWIVIQGLVQLHFIFKKIYIIKSILIKGLLLHGKNQDAKDLALRWLALVQKSGIYEQYNGETGQVFGPAGID